MRESSELPTRSDGLLDAWRELNRPYEQNDYTGPRRGPMWELRKGRQPFIVTAVHGVRHTRSGAMGKANDANTAGLALLLRRAHKVAGGTVTRSDDRPDANSDPDHPFKAALLQALRPAPLTILVDLHGMSDGHGVDVAVGIGVAPKAPSRAAAERAAAVLEAHGLTVDFAGATTGFNGAGPGTVTTWAQAAGLAAFQLEIRQGLRSFRAPAPDRQRLLRAVSAVVRDLVPHSPIRPR